MSPGFHRPLQVLFVFLLASLPAWGAPDATKAKLIQKASLFDHNRKEHKALCSTCHVRVDNTPTVRYPGHQACVNCHISEFTNSASLLCETCHTVPLNEKAETKSFTGKLRQFGLKSFSHADHMNPQKIQQAAKDTGGVQQAAMKPMKVPLCEDCHRFKGTALVAGFPAHPECYSCHVHDAGQKRGECESCHTFSNTALLYSTFPGEATTEYKFNHQAHFKSPKIQKQCERCHVRTTVTAKTEPDITKIRTIRDKKAHNSGCWEAQCHVQQKELNCKRCHVKPPVTIGL